jgi:hypothetical protein
VAPRLFVAEFCQSTAAPLERVRHAGLLGLEVAYVVYIGVQTTGSRTMTFTPTAPNASTVAGLFGVSIIYGSPN